MVNENTTLEKIMETEKGREALAKYGVPCLGCPMAAGEIAFLTIGQVADMYDLDKEGILKELNEKKE